jgi:DNA-binding NarL/FixJ family response regulator
VHTVAPGEALLSPSVTRRVIDRMAQQPTPDLADQAKLDGLTPREREVLERVARGLSNRESPPRSPSRSRPSGPT